MNAYAQVFNSDGVPTTRHNSESESVLGISDSSSKDDHDKSKLKANKGKAPLKPVGLHRPRAKVSSAMIHEIRVLPFVSILKSLIPNLKMSCQQSWESAPIRATTTKAIPNGNRKKLKNRQLRMRPQAKTMTNRSPGKNQWKQIVRWVRFGNVDGLSDLTWHFRKVGAARTPPPRTFICAVRKGPAHTPPRKQPLKVGFANSVCKYCFLKTR